MLTGIENTLSINKLNVLKPNKFICDSKSSYLIYSKYTISGHFQDNIFIHIIGGTAENWTDVAEWLVLRGARKIVVSSDSKPQQNHINRRLSLLQIYYGADIITAPNKAHTKEGAAELLSEVYFLGAIQGVFLLPNKSNVSRTSDIKPVQYIDNALRTIAPKALFVNFIGSAAGICQVRADAGFCTYNVQWDKDMTIHEAISGLDDILQCKVKNIVIRSNKTADNKQESSQDLFKSTMIINAKSVLVNFFFSNFRIESDAASFRGYHKEPEICSERAGLGSDRHRRAEGDTRTGTCLCDSRRDWTKGVR